MRVFEPTLQPFSFFTRKLLPIVLLIASGGSLPCFPVYAQGSGGVIGAATVFQKDSEAPPFWGGIAKRDSAEESLAKIMKLASEAWITRQDVEDAFGVKLMALGGWGEKKVYTYPGFKGELLYRF